MAIACSTTGFTRLPLEGALRAIRELGFQQVDLLAIEGWAHVMPSDLVRDYEAQLGSVKGSLARYGLTPLAINAGVGPLLHDRSPEARAMREAQTRALVRLMNDLDIRVASLVPREPDRARPQDEVLGDSADSLAEMLSVTQPAGITLALECHINSTVEKLDAALALLAALPELYVAYDPSHFAMQGLDLHATIPLMDRAGHVHLRDAGPGQMQVPYGRGTVNFDWLLAMLKQRGYQGGYSIEYLDGGDADVSEEILALWRKMAEHGLA